MLASVALARQAALDEQTQFLADAAQVLADIAAAGQQAAQDLAAALADVQTSNSQLVAELGLPGKLAALQQQLTAAIAEAQQARTSLVADVNQQKAALEQSFKFMKAQDDANFKLAQESYGKQQAETQTKTDAALVERVRLISAFSKEMIQHQDWAGIWQTRLNDGFQSVINAFNIPQVLTDKINHFGELYSQLKDLGAEAGMAGNDLTSMAFQGALADMVGLRALEGGLMGSDPYTLRAFGKWESLFNTITGALTLIETATMISGALSRILSPCGSWHWGTCFTAGHQILVVDEHLLRHKEAFIVSGLAQVPACDAADNGGYSILFAMAGIAVGLVGQSVAARNERKRIQSEEEVSLDNVFREWPETSGPPPDPENDSPAQEPIMSALKKPTRKPTRNPVPQSSSTPTRPRSGRSRINSGLIAKVWLGICVAILGWQGWRTLPSSSEPALASSIARSAHSIPSSLAAEFEAAHPAEWIDGIPYKRQNIETITAKQRVLSMDPETGRRGPKRVVQTFERTSDHLRLLTITDASGREQTHETTDEHPYWSADLREWRNAQVVHPGERFLSPGGEHPVLLSTEREVHSEGVPVYNFEVEDWHSYFVVGPGDDAAPILVHNASYAPGAGRPHGNSLTSAGLHDVYVIRHGKTDQILHFGETGRGYFKRFKEHQRLFKKRGIKDIYVEHLGTREGKEAAKVLENRYINTFERIFGVRPPFNFNHH